MIILEWSIKSNIITGKMNIDRNVECQDKTCYIQHDDFSCIALADGASCAMYSGAGAEGVTTAVCQFMRERFDYLYELDEEKIKYEVLCAVLRHLRKIIIEKNIKLKDLGSTLLFTAIKGNKYISMLLGDGIIAKHNKESNGYSIYSESNITGKKKHLTSSPMCYLHAHLNKGITDNTDIFFMCSDGLADNMNLNDEVLLKQSINTILEKDILECIYKETTNNIIDAATDKQGGYIYTDDCSYVALYINGNR